MIDALRAVVMGLLPGVAAAWSIGRWLDSTGVVRADLNASLAVVAMRSWRPRPSPRRALRGGRAGRPDCGIARGVTFRLYAEDLARRSKIGRSFAAVSGSSSGSTRVRPTTVMKFVSPFQRGTTCMCT